MGEILTQFFFLDSILYFVPGSHLRPMIPTSAVTAVEIITGIRQDGSVIALTATAGV